MMQQLQQEEEKKQQECLLPMGFKFRPTDRELLFCFLKNKLQDPTMFQPAAPIYDIQLYDHHPQIILDELGVRGPNNNVECYVFTMRQRKFSRWDRGSRILKDNVGYWRASYTHGDQFHESRGHGGGGLVGEKMNLAYYDLTTTNTSNTKKKGMKTDWLMNEYKIKPTDNDDDGAKEDLVLCKIYLNNRKKNKEDSNHQEQQQEQQQQHEECYNMQQDQVPYMQHYEQQPQQQERVPYMQQYEQQQHEQQPAAVDDQMPYLHQHEQQQQEQQPAAMDDQAYNSTGSYIIDTEFDQDTLWELMDQAPEPQQTVVGMISIDNYA